MTLLSQQWCDVGIAAGNDKADACAAANQTPAACTTMGSKKGAARLSLGPPLSLLFLASVLDRLQRNSLHSLEDLVVDDEGHRGDVEHGERREGHPH